MRRPAAIDVRTHGDGLPVRAAVTQELVMCGVSATKLLSKTYRQTGCSTLNCVLSMCAIRVNSIVLLSSHEYGLSILIILAKLHIQISRSTLYIEIITPCVLEVLVTVY